MARTADAALRVTESKRPILDIPLDQIRPFATQPRKHFNKEKIGQLAANIRAKGQLVPAIVRELPRAERRDKFRYELISGERRFLACQTAGIKTLTAIVFDVVDAKARFEIAVIENCHRATLWPIEEAIAWARLKENGGYTNKEVAAMVGVSELTVIHRLSLTKLDRRVQRRLQPDIPEDEQLPVTVAQHIAVLPKAEQIKVMNRYLEGAMRLVEVREHIRKQTFKGNRREGSRERQPRHDFHWVNGFMKRTEREARVIAGVPAVVLEDAFRHRKPRELAVVLETTGKAILQLGRIIARLKETQKALK